MSDQDDWNDEEKARLAGLGRTAEPPAELERRVVAALRERGEIRDAPRGRALRLAAAAVAILGAGYLLGRLTSGAAPAAPDSPAPTFALFLYPGAATPSSAPEEVLVEEYARWARGLRERGRHASGEKLKPGARFLPEVLRGTTPFDLRPESLEGFFLIQASSMDEAESIARTCPHLRRGGIVTVRAIDPT